MMPTPPLPELRFVMRIVAEVDPHLEIERRGDDSLLIIPITGGTVEGEIAGRVHPGGADWCRLRADGACEVEARYWIRTDTGAIVDVVNVGRIAPGEVPGEMGVFMTTPQFRTIEPELQWLTQRAFLGRAEAFGTHTTIDVFEAVG